MNRVFHHSEFAQTAELLKIKREKKLSISLVIPCRNEAATIKNIVTTAKSTLVLETPLIDEIIVLDGKSTDSTAQIARDAGAQVITVDDIVLPAGSPTDIPNGKGSALWKSQFVTSGDITICIDADIIDFKPHFISGLAGPLILNDEICFTKAFYHRPLIVNSTTIPDYGGRITEILVRPMLCTFLPQLAEIFQPLSGEYAFRRSVAATLPFWSGYGVEIGLLIDLVSQYGFECLAQVDMDIRCHRNRPISELGKSSFAIINTILKKLERLGKLTLNEPLLTTMHSPSLTGFDSLDITDRELPPKNSIHS